ncbi:MAG: TolC family protein [Lachnospiraceae bacterium]|nr:TolC family protein [Lachnospiraceae bacterium]
MKKRLTAAVLAVALIMGSPAVQAQAVSMDTDDSLSLENSLKLALASDSDYQSLSNELAVQKKNLRQAVSDAGGSEKEDWDWSVLLKVTLSEGQSLEEYYSTMTQTTLQQAEVTLAQAKLNSRKYELESEIAGYYIQIMTDQERILVQEELLEDKNTVLTKTKALVKSGQADSSDEESAQDEVDDLTGDIQADQDDLQTAIEGLTSLTGEEVSDDAALTGVEVDDSLWEGNLEELTDWAIENDEEYLTAWKDCLESLLSLWSDYTVLNEEYPIPDSIFEYIVSAAAGETIDTDAFYDEYTAYWEERKAALTLDKEEAGDETAEDTDGTAEDGTQTEDEAEETDDTAQEADGNTSETDDGSSSENDDYALHDAILDYQNKVLAVNKRAQELTDSVKEAYDSLTSLRDAYEEKQDDLEEHQSSQKLNRVKYRLGELSKEDYQSLTEETQTLQLDVLDARSEYWQSYYSLNSVTYGGISAIASGDLSIQEDTNEEGSEEIEEAVIVVSIQANPDEQTFSLAVTIPEEYADSIVSFELWNGDVQIGSRTSVGDTLTAASLSETSEVKLLFYDEAGGLLGEYEIDPSVPVSTLSVKIAIEMK